MPAEVVISCHLAAYLLSTRYPDQPPPMPCSDASLPSSGVGGHGPNVRRRYVTLLLLLLACLVPRALMAWKMGGICPDAVVYIQVAESFDKGLLHNAHQFGLNLFPAILMLLHRSGLDWELAGKLWNVAVSCLTVLPLYGWARRQFDNRVALAAGCLYALHSELIRWSPEGIRDPTFWFFMALSMYLLWRAVAEARLPFFLLAGLAMAMAAMTRSEGLFLLLPLLLWSFRRGNRTHHAPRDGMHHAERDEYVGALRRRLLLGAMLAVGVFPALLLLASLFWFRGHALGNWSAPIRSLLSKHWIRAGLARPSAQDQAAGTLSGTMYSWSGSVATGMRWTEMVDLFTAAMFKGMTPLFVLFACIGTGRLVADLETPRLPGDVLYRASLPPGDLDSHELRPADLENAISCPWCSRWARWPPWVCWHVRGNWRAGLKAAAGA